MRRESMVQVLVLDCLDRLLERGHTVWLQSILENGFVGFARMSEEELCRECARRGLRFEDDLDEPPHEDFDDDPDEDEDEHLGPARFERSARPSELPECS